MKLSSFEQYDFKTRLEIKKSNLSQSMDTINAGTYFHRENVLVSYYSTGVYIHNTKYDIGYFESQSEPTEFIDGEYYFKNNVLHAWKDLKPVPNFNISPKPYNIQTFDDQGIYQEGDTFVVVQMSNPSNRKVYTYCDPLSNYYFAGYNDSHFYLSKKGDKVEYLEISR